jgi:UDP-2,4-diacetamido-2,4,6-trideoxy-beta-L-altropyranose hydrolase
MKVFFRADASTTIGTGHVMRCLALAEELRKRGAECHFITRTLNGHLGELLQERGFGTTLLGPALGEAVVEPPPDHACWAEVSWEQDLLETRAVVSNADWIIVDHYSFDERWEKGLTDVVDQIMVIDDLADRPHCASLLLDQNLGRVASDYDGLVIEKCQKLIGPHFALLRPDFSAFRECALRRRQGRRPAHLLISMGGVDLIDATSKVLRALLKTDLPRELKISVVMGSRAPALDRVRALTAEMACSAKVLVDVKDMALLMAASDLAIGAGGITTWERCCLGLPSILIKTASNQRGAVEAMLAAEAAIGNVILDDPKFGDELAMAVTRLLGVELNTRISRNSAKLCSGNGTALIADLMGALT